MRFPRRAPLGAVLASVLIVPTVVVAPTFNVGSQPTPRPISPHVQQLQLTGVDRATLSASPTPDAVVKGLMHAKGISAGAARRAVGTRAPVVLTKELSTDDYRLLGVSWAANSTKQVVVTARTHTDGAWTNWFDLPPMEDTANHPSPNGRLATSPYWAGDSDGVQLRVDALTKQDPTDLHVDLIEPGTSPADAAILNPPTSGAAFASTDKPNIVTRKEWGADESLRDRHLDMGKTVQVAFVHHTAGSNNYGPNEGPAVVRGLYSYYIHTLGYADIGYNFLVDRYGHVYEGRAGSITKPVRQAATGGFNKDTMSVVAMGNFVSARAPDAMVRGIAHILAYRLSSYQRNPYGHKKLRAETGSSRYSAGQIAKFKVISGHRDAGYTACPGGRLYNRLDDIRRLTKSYMGSNLVEPSISRTSVPAGHRVDVHVRSGVLQSQNWTLTVSRLCGGGVVRRISGTAAPGKPINVTWRGRNDSGKLVPPGRYRVRLSSSGNGTQAWPWARTVSVHVGGAASRPSGTKLGRAAGGTYVPLKPNVIADSTSGKGISRPVLLGPGARVDVPVLGRGGVPSNNVSAVAVSVVASCASSRTGVSISPGGLKVPGARVVSVDTNGTARGFTMMRVGKSGDVTLRNGRGTVAVNLAVVGYVSTSGGGGSLIPLRRDSLKGANPLGVSATPVDVHVTGRAGVPNDARAVVLNVRRSSESNVSALWAWAAGADKPTPSSWRRGSGGATAQRIIVPIGAGGDIRLAADHAGKVALDVVGYVAAGDTRQLHAVVPRTVTHGGLRVHRDHAVNVSIRGRAGVPSGARAVLVQVTGINPSRNARLTVWPRGAARPNPVDLFVPKNKDRDGFALVAIGDHGDIRVHVGAGNAGVRVSVVGWLS
ncbi:MAG TPA: N-acetylmuramoyl-L-alanine amidase [Actinomycetes bacterium]|nr:N-acetylmuramoyl-L-alanine amidase [Actinomycetes bacterium]